MKDEDTLPKLPKNWIWTTLGKIGEVNLGKTPIKTHYTDHGKYKIIKFRDLVNDKIDWNINDKGFVIDSEDIISQLRELKKGDILVTASAHSSELIGKKAAYVSNIPSKYGKVFFVGELLCIRTYESVICPQMIYFYLLSQNGYKATQNHVRGVHLIASEARQIPLPLPPRPEQRRIVAKIEEFFTKLDAGINELKAVKEQLERCRQSVLNAAVKGRLTEEWREEHKDELGSALELLEMIKKSKEKRREKGRKKLPPLNTSKLSELPEVWTWVRLEDISKITMGQAPPSSTYNTNGNGLPFFQGSAEFGNICPTPTRWCSEPQKTAEKGDILISVRAPPGPTNICPERSCIGRGLAAIKGLSSIKNKYILYVLRRFEGDLASHGSSIENIRRYELGSLAIPLPPSLEQQKIVEKIDRTFSVIRESENIIQQNLKRTERLRQSILKRAFEGKLLPQDPSDNPEEKLLDRIKTEKSKQRSHKRKRGNFDDE